MAQPLAASRRALLGAAAALTAAPLSLAVAAPSLAASDAELVRVCHDFAETEWRSWWRYVVAPADLADDQDREPDWPALKWIEATPATTSAGWHAKALALAAWDHTAFDDEEAERAGAAGLLAGLLRDMVAPARAEILTRCAADYGPLPEGYTADARWISQAPAIVAAAPLPILPHADAELLTACDAFARAEQEIARLEHTADDDVFEAAVTGMHEALVWVSGLRPHTVGGLRAKAAVARAVLAADEPAAAAGIFGGSARRHDVLAWSVLSELV